MQLVIHVPHASTTIPSECLEQFGVSDAELVDEAFASADLYTDRLASEAWPDATIVSASVSRIVVDVERYADDSMESMARVGRGLLYTHTHDGRSLKRTVSDEVRNAMKQKYYDPHWARLREAAVGRILVDLHTYPLAPWVIEPEPGADRPEVDLGTAHGLTPPTWPEELASHFERAGFRVGSNTPYAGVIDAGASAAIMIEIRRDVLGSPADVVRWERMVRTLAAMPLPRT